MYHGHSVKLCYTIILLMTVSLSCVANHADNSRVGWPEDRDRTWIGPEFWANPLQDWRISNGRLECITSGANRNVVLLTHQLGEQPGNLRMSVWLGRIDLQAANPDKGLAGFHIGFRGPLGDYRNNAIQGTGWSAGINADGALAIGRGADFTTAMINDGVGLLEDVELHLAAEPAGSEYIVTLQAQDSKTGGVLGQVDRNIAADQLIGAVALVCTGDPAATNNRGARKGNMRFWFTDWQISGSKVNVNDEHVFGPILFSQYTLSDGVLKITAQMPPVGHNDSQTVRLEINRNKTGSWTEVCEAGIDALARTATFRIENWDDTKDTPYRLVYAYAGADGITKDYYWNGTVRRDPVDKEEIVVAGFTGNQDYVFPNHAIVENVKKHDPDVLFFSGDQIYESVAGYGIQREPLDIATLDYLRKWYVFGWAFGDLLRDRPSISIPDDHDVFQGNIWGNGGRKIALDNFALGGYVMDPVWVNMVHRTQVSHLPDPYDPAPVEQDILVYYTPMNYGRISFAILEDRKWKTGPSRIFPPKDGAPHHFNDPNFDPVTLDVPGAVLLGERQLSFLSDWISDWHSADMKVALSQTIFCSSASLHGPTKKRVAVDLDSNGWPQTGRNNALAELRKGFALHIAGDQHLASIIHHGIEDWNDAGWSFCVPSIAAGFPRVWDPLTPGGNRPPGMPEYTGEHLDGLGNKMTVWAVANPEQENRKGIIELARDKASGYGIARLNKSTRDITLECWPLDVDPQGPGAMQYPGWPKTINQKDNYGRKAVAYLPTIKVNGLSNPVIQVIDESDREIIYSLRINSDTFRPKIFRHGMYTIKVSEPDSGKMEILSGVHSLQQGESRTIEVGLYSR
jgi:alkaline phosphatase D